MSLPGTSWRWVRLSGVQAFDVAHPERYTVRFEPRGRYAVRADCNRGSGSYTLDGSRLRLEPGPMTLMACGPDSLSDLFLSSLGRVRTIQRVEGRLLLHLDADGGTLEMHAAPSLALPGSRWEVRAYNNGREAVVGVLEGTVLTVDFGADGGLSGSAGCNRYRATYAYVDDAISVSAPSRITQETCTEPAGVMEQEAAFLAALRTAAIFRLDGESLELRTSDDALALFMVPAADPPH